MGMTSIADVVIVVTDVVVSDVVDVVVVFVGCLVSVVNVAKSFKNIARCTRSGVIKTELRHSNNNPLNTEIFCSTRCPLHALSEEM